MKKRKVKLKGEKKPFALAAISTYFIVIGVLLLISSYMIKEFFYSKGALGMLNINLIYFVSFISIIYIATGLFLLVKKEFARILAIVLGFLQVFFGIKAFFASSAYDIALGIFSISVGAGISLYLILNKKVKLIYSN
ncbi:MAG: hypothetical protein ACP5OG_06135 [Candidatus Nanoarchaeia archaeon]